MLSFMSYHSFIHSIRFIGNSPSQSKGIWGIAFVSFFWSCSTLMVFALLPMFITEELGASKTQLGIIEGIAVSMAFMSKIFSGVLSDYFRSRKPLIIIGTIGSLLVKPLFAFALTIYWTFWAKFIDRVSQGIRSAPTDALIADYAPENKRSTVYGLRQTLYTLGAVCGGLLSSGLMWYTNEYRVVFALSILPAAMALGILYFIRQPKIPVDLPHVKYKKHHWNVRDIRYLPKSFWFLIFVTTLLMFARFSEAFLTLRAKDLGWSIAALPSFIVMYELVHCFVAFPMGRIADQTNRYVLLFLGIVMLVLTNMVFVFTHDPYMAVVATIMTGLHMGMTQGLLHSLVAVSTPASLRGTAFALYYLFSGTAVLIGNMIAGHLYDTFGSHGCFMGGLVFSGASLIVLGALIVTNKFSEKNSAFGPIAEETA